MEKIFENPMIFNGEDDNVVLVYGDFIVGKITSAISDVCIGNINKEIFDGSGFDSIIKIKEVFEYEFEPDIDSHIMFGVKNSEGKSYVTIDFQNAEVAKEAEKSIKEQFKTLGFKREEKQLTATQAAVTPGLVALFIAILGGLFTWFAYGLQGYESQRTRVVKWYVYIFVKITKVVGYYPFLIITVLLTIACLFWMVKRMANPPFKISSVKES